jgi:hypothetical protein
MKSRPPSRPSKRAIAAGMALHDPTPERRQHGRVRRSTSQVVDSNGAIGQPWVAEGLLDRLERLGEITGTERQAGERFQELFRLAALDALRAIDIARDRVSGGAHDGGISPNSERARGEIARALDAMGGPKSAAALVCWHVLGLEWRFLDFEKREGFAPDRRLSRVVSKGALIGGLGVLVKLWRIG